MDCLDGLNAAPGGAGGQGGRAGGLRTYALEADGGFPDRFDAGGMRFRTAGTGLDGVRVLRVEGGGDPCEFFLDSRDGRLFLLHAGGGPGCAQRALGALVADTGHAFDRAWFHSGMLGRFRGIAGGAAAAPGAGGEAAGAPQGRAPGHGPARGGVDASGCFAAGRGASAGDHLDAVGACMDEYSRAIRGVEDERIGICDDGGGEAIEGSPFHFKIPGRMGGLDALVSGLFDSRPPFMLWGLKTKIRDGYVKVFAVDLHTGAPLDFEITAGWMRVYLFKRCCGNTILRLLANLQARHGPGASCRELE